MDDAPTVAAERLSPPRCHTEQGIMCSFAKCFCSHATFARFLELEVVLSHRETPLGVGTVFSAIL